MLDWKTRRLHAIQQTPQVFRRWRDYGHALFLEQPGGEQLKREDIRAAIPDQSIQGVAIIVVLPQPPQPYRVFAGDAPEVIRPFDPHFVLDGLEAASDLFVVADPSQIDVGTGQ